MYRHLVMVGFEGLFPSELEIGQKAIRALNRDALPPSREYELGKGRFSIQTSYHNGVRTFDHYFVDISHVYCNGKIIDQDFLNYYDLFVPLKEKNAFFCVYVTKLER